MLQWNALVTERRAREMQDSARKLAACANSSKLSKGTTRLIGRVASSTGRDLSARQPPNSAKDRNGAVRSRLDEYLQLRAYEDPVPTCCPSPGHDQDQKLMLPNCLFFQVAATVQSKIQPQMHSVGRRDADPNNKPLLAENVVVRSERWIRNRSERLDEMKKRQIAKSLKGCTFFPKFFTKKRSVCGY